MIILATGKEGSALQVEGEFGCFEMRSHAGTLSLLMVRIIRSFQYHHPQQKKRNSSSSMYGISVAFLTWYVNKPNSLPVQCASLGRLFELSNSTLGPPVAPKHIKQFPASLSPVIAAVHIASDIRTPSGPAEFSATLYTQL